MRLARNCLAMMGLICIVGVTQPTISANAQSEKSATVTISFFSSFGRPITGCDVADFKSFNDPDKSNYANRFHGLTASGIPFGRTYRVILKCQTVAAYTPFSKGLFGPYWVSVNRAEEFIPLDAWLRRTHGDYYPHLAAYVVDDRPSSGQLWIRLIGDYSGDMEVSHVDPKSASAHFYNFEPGRFLLLLFDGDKLVCNNQIDLLGPDGQIRLFVSPSGCTVKGLAAADPVK